MKEIVLFLMYYLRARYGLRFRKREELERYQAQRIESFIRSVLSRSPYYKAFAGLPLDQYPLMNKTAMMANFDDINTCGLKQEQAMALALSAEETRDFENTLGDMAVGLSSGTSGSRGLFVTNGAERLKWAATVIAKALPGLLCHDHRIAFFLRADNKLYQTAHKRGRISVVFFDLAKPFSQHLDALYRLNPTQIIAPAQVLRLLAAEQAAGNLALTPLRITSVAEVLEPLDEQCIAAAFQQPVHQIYQCTEGFLGCTCVAGRVHLNEDFIFFEKEWVDRKSGRFFPIVTDFSRSTQPIVRYRLDDVLVLDDRPCSCGAVTQVLLRIEGRADDVLYGSAAKDGKLVPLFPDYLRQAVVRVSSALKDYTLVQLSPTKLELGVAGENLEAVWGDIAEIVQKLFVDYGCVPPEIRQALITTVPLTQKHRRISRKFSLPEGSVP